MDQVKCSRCGNRIDKGEGIHALDGVYHKDTCYEGYKKDLFDNYRWVKRETSHEDRLICPYCGYDEDEYWEYDDECGTVYCGRCEKEYKYTRHVEITYSTEPLKDEVLKKIR